MDGRVASTALPGLLPGLWLGLLLGLLLGCPQAGVSHEAGVGGDRTGCGEAGSHSVLLADHSCACEAGYDWCDPTVLDDFTCCPVDGEDGEDSEDTETGEDVGEAPDLPCGPDHFERIACVEDPELGGPQHAEIWACNGERWVHTPGYATFACAAEGFPFAFGCRAVDAELAPAFWCGHGPGTTCEEGPYLSVCTGEDLIDTCVWGKRTIDFCSRLCSELELQGPGLTGGYCEPPDEGTGTGGDTGAGDLAAMCVCT